MESEPANDHDESVPPSEDAPRLRAIAKVLPSDRASAHPEREGSSDHIHLSPRAQRRMAMGRRSGF